MTQPVLGMTQKRDTLFHNLNGLLINQTNPSKKPDSRESSTFQNFMREFMKKSNTEHEKTQKIIAELDKRYTELMESLLQGQSDQNNKIDVIQNKLVEIINRMSNIEHIITPRDPLPSNPPHPTPSNLQFETKTYKTLCKENHPIEIQMQYTSTTREKLRCPCCGTELREKSVTGHLKSKSCSAKRLCANFCTGSSSA